MPSDHFNGLTLTFAGATLGKVQSAKRTKSGAEIDCTDAAVDTEHASLVGLPKEQIDVTVIGAPACDVGDIGALVLTYPNGDTASNGGDYVCLKADEGGQLDDKVTTDYSFVPSAIAAGS